MSQSSRPDKSKTRIDKPNCAIMAGDINMPRRVLVTPPEPANTLEVLTIAE